MKICGNCKDRDVCVSICPGVERLLPKDDTGKNAHREINMDTDAFLSVVERCSYSEWEYCEVSSARLAIDLSILSIKEKAALKLRASGLTQHAAARRLKISRLALRTLINRAVTKLRVAHASHIVEDENKPGRRGGRGRV